MVFIRETEGMPSVFLQRLLVLLLFTNMQMLPKRKKNLTRLLGI